MGDQPNIKCPNCGAEARIDRVKTAMWERGQLVVVENITAVVCDQCQQQFYDDITNFLIDKLRGKNFPAEEAVGEIRVPVFSLKQPDPKQGSD